ncbi:PKD domain-containing protein [Spongiimicrobium salis]|uniref:PKD domain-containing protein n=1 Tax=Spongiimicrobium salis TaxID=1667022 RepID=UPI00374DD337
MKELLKRTTYIFILFLALSIVGCEEDDDGNLPQVEANFTFTLNEATGTVTFLNISEEAQSFEWNFGDGTTSTQVNPIKTFSSGTFTVTLTASNVAGASDTFEDELTVVVLEDIMLPISFDDPTVNNQVTAFGGASFAVVENPDLSGTNDQASNVGAITNSGAEFEGIFFDLGAQADFTDNKTISMNFWSEVAVDILLKLEQGTGADVETVVSHGGTGWEQLLFTFNTADAFTRLTLFIDGPGTTAGMFFIDDIVQIETPAGTGCTDTPVAATALPVDFEGCETFLASQNFGAGLTSAVVANPFQMGINTSDFVLQVDKVAGADFFAGIQNTFASNFDLTTTDTFTARVYSTKANVVFRFELALNPQSDPVTGNPAPVFVTIPNANEWTEIEFTFTGLPGGPMAYNQLVIKPDNDMADSPITEGGTYYIDDIDLREANGGGGGTGGTFDDGLLTNGDFENGTEAWIGNALNVVTEGGNSFNLADVQTAGNPFDVNLSQVVEITQGEMYRLTFDASSDRDRTILAGIGLNEAPFTNANQSVSLTTTTQTFTVDLSAADFGGANSRILFDMGAEVGVVVIDNVSLELIDNGGGGTGGTFDDGLLENGDFEGGAASWIGNAVNVVTEGGNSFNLADVMTAGNPFDVNLSQVVEITQGSNYRLTFDASSDRDRTILAGIGLNEAPFTNTNQSVSLTTTTQTFTLDLSAADFGGANSRVLFDMGAEIGVVVIDNVSLELIDNGGGGGTGGTFDDGLLTNGDFENGADPWIGSGLNVQTDGGNSFNFVDVQTAGNPFDVNLSQVLDITQGADYILTFDASSDRDRTMIAGIGLNVGPFTNVNETVNLTTTTQTFTLNLNATGFGGADSRVLFDMGAAVGTVVIDNVSLVLDTSGGGGGTGGAGPSFPFDFENGEAYFGAFENGATAQNIATPAAQMTGNSSGRVLEFNKAVNSAWFSGIFFDRTLRPADQPLISTDNGTVFRVRIWSPKAGITVRMRLQGDNDGNGATPVDPAFNVDLVLDTANEWVTLTFDFSAQVGANSYAYEEFVIQPDLDEVNMPPGDGSIYFIDDITQE